MVDRDPIEPVLEKLKTLREHLEIAEADTYPGGPPAWDSGNFRWAAGVCGELESLLGSARLQKELKGEGDSRMDTPNSSQAIATAKTLVADAIVALLEEAKAQRLVDGYDAAFWRDSYVMLRTAVIEHFGDYVRDDDVAEEAILVEAIEHAGAALRAQSPSVGDSTSEGSVSVNPERRKEATRVDGQRKERA